VEKKKKAYFVECHEEDACTPTGWYVASFCLFISLSLLCLCYLVSCELFISHFSAAGYMGVLCATVHIGGGRRCTDQCGWLTRPRNSVHRTMDGQVPFHVSRALLRVSMCC
jgi:hypothetical protein